MRAVQASSMSILLLALAGCGSSGRPAPPPPFVDPLTPAQRLAEVAALAGAQDKELDVQPLRDPEVDDLREQSGRAREAGDIGTAAAVLDQALELVATDPALFQERAELALLAREPARAEQFAQAALALGSRTGPLCRRHWATIWQSRLARDEQLNAESARAQIDGCTVPPIQRF